MKQGGITPRGMMMGFLGDRSGGEGPKLYANNAAAFFFIFFFRMAFSPSRCIFFFPQRSRSWLSRANREGPQAVGGGVMPHHTSADAACLCNFHGAELWLVPGTP